MSLLGKLLGRLKPAPKAEAAPEVDPAALASRGDRSGLERAVQRDPSLLRATFGAGETLLHRAVDHGHLLLAGWLLERGADPNAAAREGETPLHLAAVTGSAPLVALLLSHRAAPDATTREGLTALQLCAVQGSAEVAEALLAGGAEVDRADPSGNTALHRAAASGHVELCRVLLAHGADAGPARREGLDRGEPRGDEPPSGGGRAAAGRPGSALMAKVLAVFLSQERGTPMLRVGEATAIAGRGLEGCRHAKRTGSKRQLLLLDRASLDQLALEPGQLKENVVVEGLPLEALPAGQRLSDRARGEGRAHRPVRALPEAREAPPRAALRVVGQPRPARDRARGRHPRRGRARRAARREPRRAAANPPEAPLTLRPLRDPDVIELETQLGPLHCRIVQDGDASTPPELVVVLCHGFGAPGDDLVPVGHELLRRRASSARPIRFVFPEAPLELEPGSYPDARAWWMIDFEAIAAAQRGNPGAVRRLEEELPEGLPASRRALRSAIDALLQQTKLPASRLVLGGFSQGAMLATDVALRAEEAPAGLVVLSGALISKVEWEKRAAARAGLPVFQTHGRRDPILPYPNAEDLSRLLSGAGLQVDFRPFDGRPHHPRGGGRAAGRVPRGPAAEVAPAPLSRRSRPATCSRFVTGSANRSGSTGTSPSSSW